ncbi:unnamed protein product [Cuscuta campestris]|uniref:Uncharacterized protein n=1 Tax=Cuscuta campestris TaxID=132261 RepID=A0A484LFY8_9ASTE|nr:unnamed protein product [Cuscuta campestris]
MPNQSVLRVIFTVKFVLIIPESSESIKTEISLTASICAKIDERINSKISNGTQEKKGDERTTSRFDGESAAATTHVYESGSDDEYERPSADAAASYDESEVWSMATAATSSGSVSDAV